MSKARKTLKGKINKLIDSQIHPYFKEYPTAILVNGLLHAIIEQNPNESLRKFIEYNASKLLRHLINKHK